MPKMSMTVASGLLFSLLMQRKSGDELIDCLVWAVTDHMGLGKATREEMLPTARALRAIRIVALERN